jgi:molecular chaperone GrpE (heat shock protein)
MSESHEDLVVESDASDSTQETIVEGASSNAEVTIDDVMKERDEFKDIALRVQADFEKQGLEALDLAGQPFDPALADAVMHEEGDGSEPVVLEVLRTGYRWKGRVLRAAMVKVKG